MRREVRERPSRPGKAKFGAGSPVGIEGSRRTHARQESRYLCFRSGTDRKQLHGETPATLRHRNSAGSGQWALRDARWRPDRNQCRGGGARFLGSHEPAGTRPDRTTKHAVVFGGTGGIGASAAYVPSAQRSNALLDGHHHQWPGLKDCSFVCNSMTAFLA